MTDTGSRDGDELAAFEGLEAEAGERVGLFTDALAALLLEESGFLVLGCVEDEDLLVQFAWNRGSSSLYFEVGAAGVHDSAELRARGFATPEDESPNYRRLVEDVDPAGLAAEVEAIFLGALGRGQGYTARVDAAGS